MEFFLAVVGLCFLMWYAAKALNRVGGIFSDLSKKIENWSLSTVRLRYEQEKTLNKLKKDMERLKAIRQSMDYEERVRKEIDELTK